MTQHPQAITYPVAQLERRFAAFAVDRFIAWTLVAAVGVSTALLVPDDLWAVLGAVVGATVVVWLVLAVVLGVTGTSPGKAMTGLRVVHHGTGTPIGVGPALLRSSVLGVAGLPTFGIGLATLAWTAVEDRGRQRRGWHDHLTHTVVVDVRPAVEVTDVGVDQAPRHIVNLTAMRLVPAPPVEQVRTPDRSEHSVRRHPLPADLARPGSTPAAPAPAQQSQPVPAQPWSVPPAQQQVAAAHRTPAQPARSAPPPGTPMTPPRWRVHFDNGDGFVIAGLALVGRRPEPRAGEQVAHLVPLASADMSVSKTHAQFGPASDGTIVVMDRGSTNGTVLVRQGVARQLAPGKPASLLDGDKVVFGDREMVVSREG